MPSEEGARALGDAMLSLAKEGEGARQSLNEDQKRTLDEAVDLFSITDAILLQLKRGWAKSVFVLMLGITSVILAMRRTRGWKVALLVASGAYLMLTGGFPFSRALHWQQWEAWWILATNGIWGARTFYNGVLFPLIHVILIVALIWPMAAAMMRRPDNTPHVDARDAEDSVESSAARASGRER